MFPSRDRLRLIPYVTLHACKRHMLRNDVSKMSLQKHIYHILSCLKRAAYVKATELADMVGETAHLVDGETGEIITSSDEFYDDELADTNLECGFDPYAGCYTDDC